MLSNLAAFMAFHEEFEYHKFYGLTNTMHKSKFKRIKSFFVLIAFCVTHDIFLVLLIKHFAWRHDNK